MATPNANAKSDVNANGLLSIAIVVMSSWLPGDVSMPGDFCRMLVPADRFTAGAYHHPNPDKKVGVFVGGNYGEHRVGNLRDLDHMPAFDATDNQGAFLAVGLVYYFNLRGPTFKVDTACSSSMHPLHLAVQSIRAGESDSAVVGAAHLITHPGIWRAQADNDHVFGVVEHTGIGHNGRTGPIDPRDVGFFEAHGTGTKKGDPIEVMAIYKAVGAHFSAADPLYIGSTKPNVGHLECASGIVSIIKSVLMLYYGQYTTDRLFLLTANDETALRASMSKLGIRL
ncbi:thiolase-like protein [Lasiosphaeris hirsuta]|uniref:Thiolase-like protein n=1 Tax=Lasiosphaeris hirsuta TaxID=260670 RepID=A0AA40AY05_9PEZI|nr:thiolase-like protein [Lasiosphaeris hirsuta]